MPFTLAHPSAIGLLPPSVRRRLPFAALAIGAMAPDFEYLLRLRPLGLWGHTFPGLFWFCLPIGLLAWISWELLLRAPTRDLLALPAEGPHHLRALPWAPAALAVLLGAATHLAWDAFTHAHRGGPSLLPWLHDTAFTLGGRPFPWYNVLQHTSTVVGGAVVFSWLVRHLHRHGALSRLQRSWPRLRILLGIALFAGLAGLLNGLLEPFTTVTYADVGRTLGRVAVGGLLGAAVGLVGFALALRYGLLHSSPAA